VVVTPPKIGAANDPSSAIILLDLSTADPGRLSSGRCFQRAPQTPRSQTLRRELRGQAPGLTSVCIVLLTRLHLVSEGER
jgi:hypothetical protein